MNTTPSGRTRHVTRAVTASAAGRRSTKHSAHASTRKAKTNTEKPSSAAIHLEVGERVREVLQQLREDDREVLILRHFEMLSNGETAQVLGTSEAAASQRHLRALGRLRNLLQRYPGLKSFFS